MSVFDEFKEVLQSFNETATRSEAVAALEDRNKGQQPCPRTNPWWQG